MAKTNYERDMKDSLRQIAEALGVGLIGTPDVEFLIREARNTARDWQSVIAERTVERAALADVVEAWESLEGGRDYEPRDIEVWLAGPMVEAINKARRALGSHAQAGSRVRSKKE